MSKTKAFFLILLVAPILGGLYGLIHDQITYSISNEYYTKFKFIQFRIDNWSSAENIGTSKAPEILLQQPRFGAGVVGILATWWVGLIIGIVLSLVGMRHKTGNLMLSNTFKAIVITIAIALVIGLIGLAFGKYYLLEHRPNWNIPDNVFDRDHYLMVGSMHNFSYLGGLIGLVVAVIFSLRKSKKAKLTS